MSVICPDCKAEFPSEQDFEEHERRCEASPASACSHQWRSGAFMPSDTEDLINQIVNAADCYRPEARKDFMLRVLTELRIYVENGAANNQGPSSER